MLRRLRQWGRATAKAALAISAGALLLLMGMEGFSALPYKDIAGIWTNGFGNTHGVGPDTPPVTRAEAQVTLQAHADSFGARVLSALTRTPSQGQFDAYLLLAYNIGPSAFRTSSTVRAHNAGDFYGACLYMLRWDKATVDGVLRRVKGLNTRRWAEYNVCLSGVPDVGYRPRRTQ